MGVARQGSIRDNVSEVLDGPARPSLLRTMRRDRRPRPSTDPLAARRSRPRAPSRNAPHGRPSEFAKSWKSSGVGGAVVAEEFRLVKAPGESRSSYGAPPLSNMTSGKKETTSTLRCFSSGGAARISAQ